MTSSEHPLDTFTVEKVYGPISLSEAEFDAILDQSLSPRPSTLLADKMGELGLGPQHTLLDIGCRDAGHTLRLVERFGCRLVGVDPLDYHIQLGRELIDAFDWGASASLRHGIIEAIPAADNEFDFIWCRDMLNHVADLKAAFQECHRVLKPGGQMLIYVTLATNLLEGCEADQLYPPLGVVPSSMREHNVENAIVAAGFQLVEKDPVGSEWREHWEEDGSRVTAQQLLRVARMLRNRDAYVEQIGLEPYETELANCRWGVYQMLGKLCPTVYVIEK